MGFLGEHFRLMSSDPRVQELFLYQWWCFTRLIAMYPNSNSGTVMEKWRGIQYQYCNPYINTAGEKDELYRDLFTKNYNY
jgi:hypothetical protein